MQALDIGERYRLTVSEMSRRSQLDISTWFNEWMIGGGAKLDKLHTVSEISTQIILHSRIALYRDGAKLTEGVYRLNEDITIELPLSEANLDDLPASLVTWLIDAAGRENATTLESFLAGVTLMTARGMRTYERLSDNGRLTRQTPL